MAAVIANHIRIPFSSFFLIAVSALCITKLLAIKFIVFTPGNNSSNSGVPSGGHIDKVERKAR